MPGKAPASDNNGITSCIGLRQDRILDFTGRPLVMGIINGTPDSFFPESRAENTAAGLNQAEAMIRDGADILDIGGESSRPGSEYVDAETEISRIVPIIESIRKISSIPISVDTRKAPVAEAAAAAGADIINDISGIRDDPDLVRVAVSYSLPIVIMHMRGTPKTMQKNPSYTDAVREIRDELSVLAAGALEKGIQREHIILDPGVGFGKRFRDNIDIIRHANEFHALGFPLLYGVSRKSFIGTITDAEVEDRLPGSLAAAALLARSGVEILRVHDVKETVAVVKMVETLTAENE